MSGAGDSVAAEGGKKQQPSQKALRFIDEKTLDEFKKEYHLLRRVREFYARDDNARRLQADVLPIVEQRHERVSLRLLDWLVTNYSKCRPVQYEWDQKPYNVYEDYQRHLTAHNKRLFDPFQRRDRVRFRCAATADGAYQERELVTTIGQLNFFQWALQHGVVQYAVEHAREIEAHMNECSRDASQRRRRARDDNVSDNDDDKPKKRRKRTRKILSARAPKPRTLYANGVVASYH